MKNTMYISFFALVWLVVSAVPAVAMEISSNEHMDAAAARELLNQNSFALHSACDRNQTDIVKLLIENGVGVNLKDNDGDTPLHKAVRSNCFEAAEMLVKHNADVNIQDNGGDTPLHDACLYGYLQMVRLLIYYRANVNIQDDFGDTPFHMQALYYNSNEVNDEVLCLASCLSQRCDKNVKNNMGETAKDLLPGLLDEEVYDLFT